MTNTEELCEIRVVTYKREEWLRQALDSLIAQIHTNWVAIVLDDSPDKEAMQVVEDIGDLRIHYKNNGINIGGSRNIDLAFTDEPFFKESVYACILEDDNWFFPSFINENIALLKNHGKDILLRNQQVYERQNKYDRKEVISTTRGHYFNEGLLTSYDLHKSLFIHEGISNGGLFWSFNKKSSLVVGDLVTNSALQESIRSLQINEDIYFADKPMAAWALVGEEHKKTQSIEYWHYLRGKQSIYFQLRKLYGRKIIKHAEAYAYKVNRINNFKDASLSVFYLPTFISRLNSISTLKKVLTFLRIFVIIKSPLLFYFNKFNNEHKK